MASRRLLLATGWLVALVGCGDNSNHGNDMSSGGDLGVDGGAGPTVGGSVTGLAGSGLVLQNNGGDDLTVGASGAFTFATPLADGAGYDVSILTQPTSPPQICAVANGKGTIAGGAGVSSVAVRCAPVVRFVLVVDKLDGSVGTFALDAASGRLRYAGKSATGGQPISIATDPDGKFAYVANAGDKTVSQYAIDGNGRLSALSPATVTVGAVPFEVVLDPAGSHAYVVSSKSVAQFAVGAGGTLTALSPATVSSGSGSNAIVIEPSGRFAYVVDTGGNTVSQFSVGADGALTPLATATVATGMVPLGIAVDPTGRFVYVTNASDKTVSQYSIGSDGALAPLATATVAAGTNALSPVVDPTGRFAFVVNLGDKTVSQYSIGSDGTLTPAATATAPVGNGYSVIVDGSGKFAWVVSDMDNTVGQYIIGSNGTLAPNAPATLPGQTAPTALALVGGKGPAQPVASHAFVTDNSGSVQDFPVAANGTLGTPTAIATGHNPASIVLDAAGTHAYVCDDAGLGGAGNILQYAVSPTGAWTALTPASVAAGNEPDSIALHPSGRFAYVTNSKNSDDTVSQFAIAADGTLAPLATPTVITPSLPVAIAVEPSGRFAYVITNANGVVEYTIGANGALTIVGNPPASTMQPNGIAIDPSGRFAYVTDDNSNTLLQYSISAADGHLTALTPPSATAGTSPRFVTVDPFARYAYTVDNGACTISQYALRSGGALSPLSPATAASGNCTAMDFVAFVAVDPSGRFLYVPDDGTTSSALLQYGIGGNGALSPLSPATTTAMNGAALLRIAFLIRYQ